MSVFEIHIKSLTGLGGPDSRPLGAGSVSKETLSPCALNTLAPLAFAFQGLESEGVERLI